MGHNSGKLQFISAAILLGLLASLFTQPLINTSVTLTSDGITGGNQKAPSSAAFDLDDKYFEDYVDSVFYRVYNFSRDTNTEFGRNDLYFHEMSGDWGTVQDTDKYSIDNALTYLGLWPWLLSEARQGTPFAILDAVTTFNSTVVYSPLFTVFNESTSGSTGAFRTKMDQYGSSLIDTYTMEDNALTLYCLLKFMGSQSITGTFLQPAADKTAKYLWNYLTNTLWHPNSDNFIDNYFRVQNGTDLGDTLTFQNLLGAFVNSLVAHNGAASLAEFKTQAADISQKAVSAVNRSGIFDSFSGGGHANTENFREQVGGLGERLLRTNALGVATLADFYLRSGRAEANKSALIQAEKLYNVICTYFMNRTFSDAGAFMDELTNTAGGAPSVRTSLEGNAYWILALARLFEATGNITYYEKGIEVYNQVVANLWDAENLGFNTSRGFSENSTTKSVRDNALFYAALQELDRSYWETTFTVTRPPPNQVVYVNPIINLTCQYNVSWVRDYTSNIGINYTISQGIPWANVSFTLRNSTGDVIAKIENYTNENGTFNLLYTLPADLPLGTYIIHGYANRTGYGLKPTKILTTQFSIISNISVSKIDPAIQVVQGETKEFNITFSSTRNKATLVTYNGTGTGLNLSAQTFLLANNTFTSSLMNITADLDALVGSHEVVLTLVNDSVTLFAYLLTIEVLPAVAFGYIEYTQKIVEGFDGQAYVMLENARPSAQETVNVILSGEDLEAITLPVTLQGQEKVKVYVPLNFTGTFNKGALNFQVNLTRYTQILASNTYTTELVPAIEVQSFSTSTEIVQGRDFYINFQAINNKNVTQPVQLYININGQLTQVEINLLPGQNNIIVPRSPLTVNPWDFGTYTIDITVKVGGSAIYQDRLSVTAMTSVENVLFCYVLPIAIPIAAILIFIQRQKKRELLR